MIEISRPYMLSCTQLPVKQKDGSMSKATPLHSTIFATSCEVLMPTVFRWMNVNYDYPVEIQVRKINWVKGADGIMQDEHIVIASAKVPARQNKQKKQVNNSNKDSENEGKED